MFHPYQKFERLEERGKIIIKQKCTKAENEFYNSVIAEGEDLPSGIRQFLSKNDEPTGKFYKILTDGMSDDELERYVLLLQHQELTKIRKTLRRLSIVKIFKALGFLIIVGACAIWGVIGISLLF